MKEAANNTTTSKRLTALGNMEILITIITGIILMTTITTTTITSGSLMVHNMVYSLKKKHTHTQSASQNKSTREAQTFNKKTHMTDTDAGEEKPQLGSH